MTFEVKAFVLKNPTVILRLIITFAFTAMGTFLLTKSTFDNFAYSIPISASMTLAFPLTLAYTLTSKVKFDEDSVVKFSFFGTTKLKMEKIKTYGVLGQSKSGNWLANPDNTNENDLVDSYYIFISESDKFDLDSTTPKNNIKIQFRKDVYENVKEWIKKASAQQCV